ncbi:MAG: hypothetical protein Q6358_08230 [Candidatus Brocadiales bacterium]|nr:hypothetical protein [Candidatus Brocadiales bacterium]
MANNVVIPNLKKLEKLKKSFFRDGSSNIHVLADFDRTLTYAFVDGEKIPSIISVLRDGTYLTPDYAEKAHALFNKYHPIEVNPHLSLQKKKKAMLRWWGEHSDLLVQSGLNKKDLEKVAGSPKIKFREGALDFIDFLHSHDIPIVVMSSSGLGKDAVSLCFQRHMRLYSNVHIISNSFVWDKNDNATGFKKPIIHSMNKDETMLHDFPVYDLVKNRKNVLLLGDTLEDVGMIEGFDYKNLIKIGFLNENVDDNLEYYKKNYDVVILNDSSMEYINELLKSIIEF